MVLTLAAVLTLRQLALAMFQVGEDMGQAGGSSVSGVDMSGAGPQTWYQSARGGRGMCSTHAECNGRGACHRGICVCAVLWGGAHCDQALDVPATPGLPKFFTRLGAPFRGAFGMSRMNVGSRTAFEHYVFVNNPAVSHGQQVLGAVDAALLRALPSSDAIRPRVPYTSCAVVGSSGAMLSYENGVSIDEHQMVLRFNDAPTKGFELYVGGKTTHRMCTGINSGGPAGMGACGFRETAGERVIMNVTSPKSFKAFVREHRNHVNKRGGARGAGGGGSGDEWVAKRMDEVGGAGGSLGSISDIGGTRDADALKLYMVHPDFTHYVMRLFQGYNRITTGVYGVMFALQQCQSVDLYGFGLNARHGFRNHYYRSGEDKGAVDKDDVEHRIVRALVRQGLVRVAERCVAECHASKEACRECQRHLLPRSDFAAAAGGEEEGRER